MNENSPTVSVLMPVHNGARYLIEAIESILNQSWGDFEFIIVDDGSTDETPGLLAEQIDPRIRVLRMPKGGIVPALNAGLAAASGRYVARMDADDFSLPTRLERQVEWMERHPEIGVLSTAAERIDSAGRSLGPQPGYDPHQMWLELAAGNPVVHGSVMMRRAILPPPPTYRGVPEDYDLWIRLARQGVRFGYLDECLYRFRTHEQRASLVHARPLCDGIVDLQLPLLEEWSGRPERADPRVAAKLLHGWGSVAAAAFVAGRSVETRRALAAFRAFAAVAKDDAGRAAFDHGVEAMIWAHCPLTTALYLRLVQVAREPANRRHYRNLAILLAERSGLAKIVRRQNADNAAGDLESPGRIEANRLR